MATQSREARVFEPKQPDTLWWPPFAIVLSWVLLSLPSVFWTTSVDQANNPPTCFGIGWGCTLDPGTTVFFFAFLLALPGLAIASVFLAVVGRFGFRTRRCRLWGAGVVPPLLLVWWHLIG